MNREHRLRILFFVERTGFLRQFASLVQELGERGHEVHLAFSYVRPKAQGLLEQAVGDSPQVTYGLAPQRSDRDGWGPIAWLVRAIGDLARYSHPRYEAAPVLRRRTARKVLDRLEHPREIEPPGYRLARRLARRLASRTDARLSKRVIRAAGRLESAIPSSRRIERYLREQRADVVLVTPAVKQASDQVEYLKSARRLRIPGGVCVASWDNLTNKGLLKFAPERVFVWNEVQRGEAVELHGIPAERVVATGAQLFDEWFGRQPSARKEFVPYVDLDPARPYVLYVCSSPFVTNDADDEVRFVFRWIDALRSSEDERLRGMGVLIRPHPVGKQWGAVDPQPRENVVVWPRKGARHLEEKARAGFYDSLFHSVAVVGINTTAMIEAAIAGKQVLTVLEPEFAQESTLHFHYLLAENGGFLHVASSLEEHAAQLSRVLDETDADAERRERFVESFVRPRGLERSATSILADEIEELARLPVQRPRALGRLPLRVVLGFEAGLCSLLIAAQGPRRSLRRLRRRVVGKAQQHGLLPSRSEASSLP